MAAGRNRACGPLRRSVAGFGAGAPGVQGRNENPTSTSGRKLCLCAASPGGTGNCGAARSTEMNETEEREGLQEAPEQPEPPRTRDGSALRKVTLPADADLERLVHETSGEILTAVAADPRLSEDLALA